MQQTKKGDRHKISPGSRRVTYFFIQRQVNGIMIVLHLFRYSIIYKEDINQCQERYININIQKHSWTTCYTKWGVLCWPLTYMSDCLTKAIKQLGLNKSSGPHLYLNEFFMYGKNVLASSILPLFNINFELGYFPETWSTGFVIPLHKWRK